MSTRQGIIAIFIVVLLGAAIWARLHLTVSPASMDRYAAAADLMTNGHADQAVAIWQSLVRDDPGFVDPYLRLSEYYNRIADPDKAVSLLDQYLKNHEATPEIKLNLAEALVRTRDRQTALKAALSAVQALPNSARAHMALAAIYSQLLDPRGLPEILKAERLDPKNPSIYLLAGQLYADQQEPQNVEAQMRTGTLLDPQNPEMLYLLGWALAQQPSPEHFSEALTLLQRAVQLNPNAFSCWIEMGDVLEKQHRYGDAVVPLKHAQQLGAVLPNGMPMTHARLQERITADHMLLEAYQHTGHEALEPPVRADAARLQAAVQALLKRGIL
jgi:cytochrome c-type biogenesis protein CcmH/NrfG